MYDHFYPEEAQRRYIRQRVVSCYTYAAPEKLDSVDNFLKKYQQREHILFAQLAAKYPKVPECNIR